MKTILDIDQMRECIDNMGVKHKFFAAKMEISPRDFSLIMTKKKNCPLDLYIKICDELKKPYGSFIKKEEQKATNQ